jgi:orotidine-5'-phosphate decarboxylase
MSISRVFFPVVPSPARPAVSTVGFGDRLASLVQQRESQIVLGLDPDPMRLWPATVERARSRDSDVLPVQRAAMAMLTHCRELIDAVGPACVAVKPQLARFEVLGAAGWTVLSAVVGHAQSAGLLVIADGKRGDIDVSAGAYAKALQGSSDTPFGNVDGLGVDLVTVNPLMGSDAIEPFVLTARASESGVLVLVRTSNPGAADIEDLEVVGGGRVWERIALVVARLGEGSVGERGLSDVGAVVGATAPEHLARARELMPHAVFLLPGVGAQGGRVEDLTAAFAPGRAGGLISASRSIVDAYRADDGDPADAARAEAERLRELAWTLSGP